MRDDTDTRALEMIVGRLDGRLDEVAARMNRIEDAMSADRSGINAKLDRITEAVAAATGAHAAGTALTGWAIALLGTVSGWAYTFLHPK